MEALVIEGPAGPQVFTLASAEAASNALRGAMLAQVSDAVLAVDLNGRLTYLNAAAERMYGVLKPRRCWASRWTPSTTGAGWSRRRRRAPRRRWPPAASGGGRACTSCATAGCGGSSRASPAWRRWMETRPACWR
ncbi:MAG: PAS domain-containing protein [Gemmatimonadetes bacterium]|nr:PAS domain-containing protein [Gemmatimonadota bacterium]